MQAFRQVLQLLVAMGLLAAWVGQPELVRADHAPVWRSGGHVAAATTHEARAAVLPPDPADDDVGPGKKDSGGAGSAAAPARQWIVPACGDANCLAGEAGLECALTQPHLRVNGSANAQGARA